MKTNIIIIAAIIAVTAGCSTKKSEFFRDYKETKKISSIEAQERFLRKWGSGLGRHERIQSSLRRSGTLEYQEIYMQLFKQKAERSRELNTLEAYDRLIDDYWDGGKEVLREVSKIKKIAYQRRLQLIKNKTRKISNWRDIHVLTNSNFYDKIISKPPLNVEKNMYTWDGVLKTEIKKFYIFKNIKGDFAVRKPFGPKFANVKLNTRYILIGKHLKNENFTTVSGRKKTIPVLESPAVFSHEESYWAKL